MILQSSAVSPSPMIDAAEAAWAADELNRLIQQVSRDSIVGLVLGHAEQELRGLVQCAQAESAQAEVIGPIRIRVAA